MKPLCDLLVVKDTKIVTVILDALINMFTVSDPGGGGGGGGGYRASPVLPCSLWESSLRISDYGYLFKDSLGWLVEFIIRVFNSNPNCLSKSSFHANFIGYIAVVFRTLL